MNTHTDKELLELAAKAAGYKLTWKTGHCKGGAFSGAFITDKDDAWNPLSDDGDALRLAINTGMIVDCEFYVNHENPDDIVRRSIVLAAAEIGKTL